jgi:hypothetical protein
MRTVIKQVKAKELGGTLRRRLRLAPEDEIDVAVTKRSVARSEKDPWQRMKGILSAEQADEMIRVIMESRRSKVSVPDVGDP